MPENVADERAAAWVPADVDLDRPNAARVYDYYLGGTHNLSSTGNSPTTRRNACPTSITSR